MPETQFPNLQQKLQSQLSGTNGRLKFPLDNQDDYKGRIIFSVFDEDAARVQFGKAIQKGVNTTKKAAVQVVAEASAPRNDIGDFVANPSVNPAQLQTDIRKRVDNFVQDVGSKFGELAGRLVDSVTAAPDDENFSAVTDVLKINQEAGSVELYLPQQLQIQDGVSINTSMELGLIGGAIEKGLSTTANAGIGSLLGIAADQVAKGIGATVGSLTGTAQLSEGMAALAAQRIAKRIPLYGQDTIRGVQQLTGVVANPNRRAQFDSVPLRQFSFNFTLIAKSKSEADEITKIIKWFRTELYPEALIAGGVHYGYKFPNRFQIKIKYGNQNDSQAANIRFLPVYLQSFTTNYNPNGMGMHSDGSFAEVSCSMSFTETRALNRQDIVERGF